MVGMVVDMQVERGQVVKRRRRFVGAFVAVVAVGTLAGATDAMAWGRPIPPRPPRDATAKCRDGSYSFVRFLGVACRGHGGVLKKL